MMIVVQAGLEPAVSALRTRRDNQLLPLDHVLRADRDSNPAPLLRRQSLCPLSYRRILESLAMTDTAEDICGHQCPRHPDYLPCQLPKGHDRVGGHRDSRNKDVQHVWQDHGHTSDS